MLECNVLQDEIMNTSDHRPVQMILEIQCSDNTNTAVRPTPSIKWNRIKQDVIRERYTNVLKDFAIRCKNNNELLTLDEVQLDNCIDELVSNMVTASDTLPKSKYRQHIKPY